MLSHRNAAVLLRILKLPCSRIVSSAQGLKKVTAFFMMLFQLCGALLFDWPTTPGGPDIDMSKFELVWSDEFAAAPLDRDTWGGVWSWWTDGLYRRDGDWAWWDPAQITFEDGSMVITTEYRDGRMGPGWYTCEVISRPDYTQGGIGYEQQYGYFEIRCILPKGDGLNTAFWLLCEGMFENNPSGTVGSEIDVFETKTNPSGSTKRWKDSVYHTIHVGGYGENHRQEVQGHFYPDNPTEQFNTYGVEWNENEYIFYINGAESARTSFAGPARVPMYLLLTIGVDENVQANRELPAKWTIDYVRAYQYKAIP